MVGDETHNGDAENEQTFKNVSGPRYVGQTTTRPAFIVTETAQCCLNRVTQWQQQADEVVDATRKLVDGFSLASWRRSQTTVDRTLPGTSRAQSTYAMTSNTA